MKAIFGKMLHLKIKIQIKTYLKVPNNQNQYKTKHKTIKSMLITRELLKGKFKNVCKKKTKL